jgi:Ca-activated chloride channel family protein
MEQAKNALHYCLDNLNSQDRFTVITFNEGADSLSRGLIPASLENVKKAHKFVSDVEATGGTNIDEALRAGLTLLREAEGSQKMVVFLTDGLPTVGETNVETILANVRKLNGTSRIASASSPRIGGWGADLKARLFAFGVGYDVNIPFLDRLAAENRGDADYVRPNESIEGVVSAFFSKISSPVLAGLKLEFDDAEVYDLYPRSLPDLFKGTQAVITGRFRGDPRGGVKLTGHANDRPQTFRLANAFDGGAARNSLVPRIWASRKIGYLLDQIRLSANQEVIDEIIRLSKEYGIITPYTSYLADERQDRGVVRRELGERVLSYDFDGAVRLSAEDAARRDLFALSRNKDVSGQAEALRSLNAKGYQGAARAPSAAQSAGQVGGGELGGQLRVFARESPAGPAGIGADRKNLGLDFNKADLGPGRGADLVDLPGYRQVQANARVQNVAGRTFFKRGEVWFDNNYKNGRKVVQIKSLSDAHFQLLDSVPSLARYASVGDEVLIDLGKAAIQLGKTGKEKLSASELRELTGK